MTTDEIQKQEHITRDGLPWNLNENCHVEIDLEGYGKIVLTNSDIREMQNAVDYWHLVESFENDSDIGFSYNQIVSRNGNGMPM